MRIFTHDGIFHADEIFAIVALTTIHPRFDNSKIIRTREVYEITRAKSTVSAFIDVGGIYNSSELCFDHHQDKDLPASNLMVWNYLGNNGFVNSGLHHEMLPFMIGISNYDTDTNGANTSWKSFNRNKIWRNVSELIGAFNVDPGNKEAQDAAFVEALKFAKIIFDNEVRAAQTRIKDRIVFDRSQVYPDKYCIYDAYCSIWRQQPEPFAILPNPQGWALNAKDTSICPLPDLEGTKGLIFAHQKRFIAIYDTLENAKEAIKICF